MKKHYTPKQKAQIVLEILKEERSIAQIASDNGVHSEPALQVEGAGVENLPGLFEDDHKSEKALKAEYERQVKELYAEIGKLTTQLAWLKKKSGIEPLAE